MSVKLLASILLIGRLVSVVFISLVIRRQWTLFKSKIAPHLVSFRRNLFILSIVILLGQVVPIIIDTLAIYADVSKSSASPSPIGVAYAVSNCLTSILSAIFIWTLYRMAARQLITTDKTEAGLRRKSDVIIEDHINKAMS